MKKILISQYNLAKTPVLFKGQIFKSYSEAKTVVERWSQKGFHPIHIERSVRLIDSDQSLQDRVVYNQVMHTCVHYGKDRETQRKNIRPFQHHLRMQCPVMVNLKYDRQTDKVIVTNIVEDHNHPVSEELFARYPKNRRPNEEERREIERLLDLKVSAVVLRDHMKNESGKHMKLKDVHNIKQDMKAAHKNGRTEAEQLYDTISHLEKEGYIFELVTDETGRLQLMYMQTSEMKEVFNIYPDTVFIDATYKTNKEGFALQCLAIENSSGKSEHVAYCFLREENEDMLSKMCTIFKKHNPKWSEIKHFMLDKDMSEINALRKNFNAKLLLCTFHVIKAWKKKIAELVVSKKVKREILSVLRSILYSSSENAYCDNVQNLKDICQNEDFVHYFLTHWDSCQDMWAHCYRRRLSLMGNNTNNRLESHFQKLKKVLHHNLSISEALSQLVEFINRREFDKKFQKCESQCTLLCDTRVSSSITEDFSKLLSDKAFRMVLEQLHISEKSKYKCTFNGEDFTISWVDKCAFVERTVSKDMTGCTCNYSLNFGLPCAHILFCRAHRKTPLLDISLVHSRWLKHKEVPKLDNLEKSSTISISEPKTLSLSANEKYSCMYPLAAELASHVSSCGGQEFEYKRGLLKDLLHSWKQNKEVQITVVENHKSVGIVMPKKPGSADALVDSKTKEPPKNEATKDSGQEEKRLESGIINKHSSVKTDDMRSFLKITPAKRRRGRPKKQQNFTFNSTFKKKHTAQKQGKPVDDFQVDCETQHGVSETEQSSKEIRRSKRKLCFSLNRTAKKMCSIQKAAECSQGLQVQNTFATVKKQLAVCATESLSVEGITLSSDDLATLDPDRWLNDNVVHAYLHHLASKSETKVFVFQCFLEQLWRKEDYTTWKYNKVQFQDFTWALLPVCRFSHWFLTAFNIPERKVFVLDSLKSTAKHREFLSHWCNFMKTRSSLGIETLDGWTLGSIDVPFQSDGTNCGVFLLMNAESLLQEVKTSYQTKDINRLRQNIKDKILGKK